MHAVNSRVGDTLWVFSKSVANAGVSPRREFRTAALPAMVGSLEKRSLTITRECRPRGSVAKRELTVSDYTYGIIDL